MYKSNNFEKLLNYKIVLRHQCFVTPKVEQTTYSYLQQTSDKIQAYQCNHYLPVNIMFPGKYYRCHFTWP